MTLTSLHLQASPPKALAKLPEARCPQCNAGKDRRINAGGFGGYAVILCEHCGYEYKETA